MEKASAVFTMMCVIFGTKRISAYMKMRFYDLLVFATVLYSSETWNLTTAGLID